MKNKEKHFWNVKSVKGKPASSEAVLIHQLAPYSVKIYLIDSKAKQHQPFCRIIQHQM